MRRLTRGSMAVVVAVLLAACGDTDGDGDLDADPVAAAEQRVASAEADVEEARAAFDEASADFCDDASGFLTAVDRYGGLLADPEATVGTVKTAGADLRAPESDARDSAEAASDANAAVADAEEALAEAERALEEVQTGTTAAEDDTPATAEPLVAEATVDRVEDAQADLDAAFAEITDDTALQDAGEQVNAAAFALEVAWLRLLSDAGCLTEDQQAEAADALSEYTAGLQSALTMAGYYDGEIDGVYGPETSGAVSELQTDSDLPATGFVDQATALALEEALTAAGGEAANQAVAHTAALQSLLTVAGYWTGPIDGAWSDALTAALKEAQADLGVPATGVVDAATLAAIQQAIAEATSPATTTTTADPESTTTTT